MPLPERRQIVPGNAVKGREPLIYFTVPEMADLLR